MQLKWFGLKRKRYTARNTANARLRLWLEQLEKREVLSYTLGDLLVSHVGTGVAALTAS